MRTLLPILSLMSLLACGSGKNGTDDASTTQDTSLIGRLRFAIKAYPDSPVLQIRLMDAYEEKKEYPSAKSLVDSLLLLDSTAAYLHYRKARLNLLSGDTTSGMAGLKRALSFAPDNTDILLELAYVLSNRGSAGALTIADTVISVSEDADTRSRARLLKGIYFSNKGNKAAALKEYDASIVDNYTFLDAFMEKAIVLYEMKRYDEAQSTLDKAQAIRPADAEIYLWKGKCHQAGGHRAEAMDNYKKCLGLDPGMKEAADLLSGLESSK